MKPKSFLAVILFLFNTAFLLQAQTDSPIVSEELIFGSPKGLIVVEARHGIPMPIPASHIRLLRFAVILKKVRIQSPYPDVLKGICWIKLPS